MERWRRGGCLLAVALAAAMVLASAVPGEAKLSPGYYRSTCPRVESIVRAAVARKVKETFVTVPATLRLFFHDCFVQVSAGLRRVGDDRVRHQRRREGRAGQPVPRRRRLRHRRARQGRRREGLPRRGLLRRRPRPRRQGRRHHVVRPALDSGARPAGRARLQGQRRHGQAAGAGHAARHHRRDVRRQQPHRRRHGRALGRAHRRLLPLHALRRPALPLQRGGGPVVLQGVVCAAADGGVPARRWPDHRRRHGPRHAHRLRQHLLRQPRRRARALRLRPGAARRRRVAARGGGVRQ
nr:uncharacterized protein LOC127302325 isoform X2 [Lolium perenne]